MTTRIIAMLCAAFVVGGCAGNSNVIRTPGTESRPVTELARLQIPHALTLLSVDGEKLDSVRSPNDYEVALKPGLRRLRFVYEKEWGNPNTYDWVYSEQVVEIAFEMRPGVVYRAGYPAVANRYEAARMARDLRVWIDAPDGTRTSSQQVALYGSPFMRLLRSEGNDENITAGAATGAASGTAGNPDLSAAAASEHDALQRLKLWWNLASNEQRRAFLLWTETQ